MSTPTDIYAGTVSFTNGEVDFTGTGTSFVASLVGQGDLFVFIEGGEAWAPPIVATITGNGAGTLTEPWAGPDLTDVRYRLRYQWDSARVGALTRNLAEQLDNGNVQALSGLTGPGVIVMDGLHTMIIKPETDFINGIAVSARVATLPERDAYDGQSAGFSVYVLNIGGGIGATYFKQSNASGDWSPPGYVTGAVGPMPTLEAEVTVLPSSGTASVIVTPVTGGYSLDFQLPAADGFYWEGVYNAALAYPKDSVVRRNGSSFIAIQDAPAGQQPSAATPPVDNAYWEVLAIKGVDGAGTVTTLVEGDGITIDATDPTMPVILVDGATATPLLTVMAGDAGSGGVKGLVPAPTAGDAAANKFLRADGAWGAIPEPDTLSVSVLALQTADNANAPIYGPNWIADAFDTLGLVDVAGATNLDTSVPGLLKPTTSPATRSFKSATIETTDTTTATFAAVDIGTAATDRIVVVSLANIASGGATATSVTIGGVTATLLQGRANGNYYSAIYAAAVPTGTTATIVVIWSTTALWTDISVWSAYGATLTSPIVGSSVANPLTATLAVPAGSVVFGVATDGNTTTFTWSGLTENSDNQPETRTVSTASAEIASAQSLVITAAAAASVSGNTGCFVALRPSGLTNDNMTVRSTAMAASSVPVSIAAILQIKEIDAAILGTDCSVEFTRDDGTTWTVATLTELFGSSSPIAGVIFVLAVANVAAQPSGTAVRWRIKTLTGKMIEFHGIKTDRN